MSNNVESLETLRARRMKLEAEVKGSYARQQELFKQMESCLDRMTGIVLDMVEIPVD